MMDRTVLRARIDEVARNRGFSGAVRVTIQGDLACEDAYGLADRARGIPNTVSTRFGSASATKLFTALGIGLLIDRGDITLDTRVAKVMAPPPANLRADVTVRHLLGHTAGVHDYYDEDVIDDYDSFELPIPPYRLVTVADYRPLLEAGEAKFAPGERFSYSNGGYVILGLVIEEVARVSYQRFIETQLFEPAGMRGSGFFRFDQLPDGVAHGYIDDAGGWRTNIYALPIVGGPDGGAFTTVGDLERLWQALLARRVLSPALTQAYLSRQATWRSDTHYGFGLWLHDDGQHPARHYIEGCDAGVSCRSTAYAPGTIATVLSNTTDGAWALSAELDRVIPHMV